MTIYRTYSHHSSNICFTIYWTCFFRSAYFIHFLYNVPPLQETVGLRWRFARAQRSESRETWRSPAMDCWWQGWVLLWMATPFPFREMNIKWPYIYIYIYTYLFSGYIFMKYFDGYIHGHIMYMYIYPIVESEIMYVYIYIYTHKVVYIIIYITRIKPTRHETVGCLKMVFIYVLYLLLYLLV